MLLKLFLCAGNVSEGGLVKARLSQGSTWGKVSPNADDTLREFRRSSSPILTRIA